jgi:hypothetical protein
LLTVTAPIRTPEAKRLAAGRTGAVAVDMEACGVARAAAELGIPWLALKAVLDPLEESLPPWLFRCSSPAGNLRWRGILAALLRGRSARRTLDGLRRSARLAGGGLTRGLAPALQAWARLDAPRPLQ